MIMLILGLPDKDKEMMLRFSEGILQASDPSVTKSQELEDISLGFFQIMTEMNVYFKAVTEDRRKQPTDDLSTVLALAQIDGGSQQFINL
jgi:cytochrome P450